MGRTQRLVLEVVGKDNASAVFKKIGKALGVSAKDAEKGMKVMAGSAIAAGTAIAALAINAGKFESVSDSFRTMTRGIGVDGNKLIRDVKSAVSGTVTEMEVMQSFMRATTLIGSEALGKQGENFIKFSEIAKKASRVTGQDVNFMMTSIVNGIGKTSKVWLDNTGIVIEVTDAYDAYRQELGLGNAELTKTQEKIALTNAFLKEAEKAYGDVAVSAGGISSSWARVRVVLSEAATEIGMALIPAVQPLVEFVGELLRKLSFLIPTLKSIVSGITDFVRSNWGMIQSIGRLLFIIGLVVTSFILGAKTIAFFKTAVLVATGAAKAFTGMLAIVRTGLTLTQLSAGLLGIAMIALAALMGKSIMEQMDMTGGVDAMGDSMEDATKTTQGLESAFGGLGDTAQETGQEIAKAAEEAEERIADLQRSIEEENEAFNEQLANIADLREQSVRDNKDQLAKEKEDFKEAKQDMTAKAKNEIDKQKEANRDKVDDIKAKIGEELALGANADKTKLEGLQELLAEEKRLGQEKIADIKQKRKEDLQELKKDFSEKKNALVEKIEEDEKFLKKHAEVIKTINRNVIKDEIEKLVKSHTRRIEELDKQIAKEKIKFTEGGKNFKSTVGGMGADWSNFIDNANMEEINMDELIAPIDWKKAFGSVGEELGAIFNKAAVVVAAAITVLLEVALKLIRGILLKIPIKGQEIADKIVPESSIQNAQANTEAILAELSTPSEIQQLASGTDFARGGLALVGEQGPELVDLPRGSRVSDAQETKQAMGGGSNVSFNINIPMFTGDAQSKRQVAEEIWKELQRIAFSRGQSPTDFLALS